MVAGPPKHPKMIKFSGKSILVVGYRHWWKPIWRVQDQATQSGDVERQTNGAASCRCL